MSKVYRLLKDFSYTTKDIFGDLVITNLPEGTMCYEGIDYECGYATHYFTKRKGNGGDKVQTREFVENNPDIFELLHTI